MTYEQTIGRYVESYAADHIPAYLRTDVGLHGGLRTAIKAISQTGPCRFVLTVVRRSKWGTGAVRLEWWAGTPQPLALKFEQYKGRGTLGCEPGLAVEQRQ
jgi:hypothetical protein